MVSERFITLTQSICMQHPSLTGSPPPSIPHTRTHSLDVLLNANTHTQNGGRWKIASAHEGLRRGHGVKPRWSGLEKVQRSGTITPPPTQADLPLRYGPSPRSALSGYPLRLVWTPTPPPHSLGHGLGFCPEVKDEAEAEGAAGLEIGYFGVSIFMHLTVS